ncbi:MAG: hypothetical protein ACK5VS_16260, partial [Hyphomonadaceae bacterium]
KRLNNHSKYLIFGLHIDHKEHAFSLERKYGNPASDTPYRIKASLISYQALALTHENAAKAGSFGGRVARPILGGETWGLEEGLAKCCWTRAQSFGA